ncbi:hypothetical protein R8510_04042 [Ralstonia chuxiongensis]|nr:hypothetical protein R8510_04042 [Ralstonia chuxiongensis]
MEKARRQRKSKVSLSVEERVRAALDLHRVEDPARLPSVAELCRQAGVSRANLYVSHAELVAAILGRSVQSKKKSSPSKVKVAASVEQPSRAVTSVREKALLYLCLELQTEVIRLRALRDGTRRSARRIPAT